YADRSAGNFALSANGPCAGFGPGGTTIQHPAPPPPPPAPAVAPQSTGAPSVSGMTRVGSRLTASTGSWSGTSPVTYTYSWLRCDARGAECAGSRCNGTPYS